MNTSCSGRLHPFNTPKYERLSPEKLEAMSPSELADALEQALDSMTEETYEAELINAYLEALDRKVPAPKTPSTDEAYACLQKQLRSLSEKDSANLFDDVVPYKIKHYKTKHVLRFGLVAIVSLICMLGFMVVAQASGMDVFGAMARWTDEIFSLGSIQATGTKDDTDMPQSQSKETYRSNSEYNSLQDTLDAHGVTEVSAPTWIPEEYMLDKIDVTYLAEHDFLHITAAYTDETNPLYIEIQSYVNEPSIQIEKTDTNVQAFYSNGTEAYLIENINNITVAWATEHYECYIIGTEDINVLKEIALSAHADKR